MSSKPIEIIDSNAPLCNSQAEHDVLTAIIYGRSTEGILDDYFYDANYKAIFQAIKYIRNEGKVPDIVQIADYFLSLPSVSDGKPVYKPAPEIIAGVADTLAGTADATFSQNVALLAQLYKRRKAREIGLKLIASANERSLDIDSVLNEIQLEKEAVVSTSDKYKKLLEIPSPEEIRKALREVPEGIQTNYAFERKNKELQQLILPSGAITLICGQTSHGKSRFLQNLALDAATDGKEGTVLYFTFEEDKNAVYKEFLNIYANMDIAKNNLRSIGSFFRGIFKYFMKKVSVASFMEKENRFMDDIIQTGKLRVLEEDYDSTELILALRILAKTTKVKAVFVDYVQLLSKAGNKLSRPEELKEIGKDLLKLAKETGLPIVMAAQLNREAKSPSEMHNQNISEASDLEKVASVIVMIWNSSFKSLNKSDYTNDLASRGFNLGEDGKIYAICTKYRGAERGNDAILKFNGNTGKIYPNYDSETESSVSDRSDEIEEDGIL